MKNKKVYIIHDVTDNKYMLCKVLNEYNSKEAANQELIKLLTKKKTEKEMLKEYSQNDI
jgi:hypoxanthine-guanine phosphoribosyltransferase